MPPRILRRFMYITPSSDHSLLTLKLPFKVILRTFKVVFWCLEWEWCTFKETDENSFNSTNTISTMALMPYRFLNLINIVRPLNSSRYWWITTKDKVFWISLCISYSGLDFKAYQYHMWWARQAVLRLIPHFLHQHAVLPMWMGGSASNRNSLGSFPNFKLCAFLLNLPYPHLAKQCMGGRSLRGIEYLASLCDADSLITSVRLY